MYFNKIAVVYKDSQPFLGFHSVSLFSFIISYHQKRTCINVLNGISFSHPVPNFMKIIAINRLFGLVKVKIIIMTNILQHRKGKAKVKELNTLFD